MKQDPLMEERIQQSRLSYKQARQWNSVIDLTARAVPPKFKAVTGDVEIWDCKGTRASLALRRYLVLKSGGAQQGHDEGAYSPPLAEVPLATLTAPGPGRRFEVQAAMTLNEHNATASSAIDETRNTP